MFNALLSHQAALDIGDKLGGKGFTVRLSWVWKLSSSSPFLMLVKNWVSYLASLSFKFFLPEIGNQEIYVRQWVICWYKIREHGKCEQVNHDYGFFILLNPPKWLQVSVWLCDLWAIAHQAPLSIKFSRQEYSGLPFPYPESTRLRIEPGLPHHRQIIYCVNHQKWHNVIPQNKQLQGQVLTTLFEGM